MTRNYDELERDCNQEKYVRITLLELLAESSDSLQAVFSARLGLFHDMPDPVVVQFVDAAIAQLRRLDLMRWPGKLPESMRDESIAPSKDWVGWRPIPSTVTDGDLDSMERETGLIFPSLYRDFLQYLHFVDLTEAGVRFERHLCYDWRETLRKAYFRSWPRERILDSGLIPFGDESLMDAGPVCFDTRRRLRDGDCPVVFWDHEWVGTNKEVQQIFSSCRKMFECLVLVATTDLNFVYHDSNDDSSLLPQKRELLTQFLSLDPDGAGGAGRSYWTCWGALFESANDRLSESRVSAPLAFAFPRPLVRRALPVVVLRSCL